MNENNDLLSRFGFWLINRRSAQKHFFAQNQQSSNQIMRGQVYINTQVPYQLVNSIPEISIPIRRIASMFANGVFKLQSESDEKTIKPLPEDLQKLFKKPNITQSQNEWLKQYLMQLQAYGNQYQKINQPSKMVVPKSIINLDPSLTSPYLTGKYLDQIDMSGIVEKYVFCENNRELPIPVNEVIWSRIGDLNSPLVGKSLISSLQFPISGTELAYKYLNAISNGKGAIGILSNNKKDMDGGVPLTHEERTRLENQYAGDRGEYGIEEGQKAMMLTNASLTYTPIGYETKKLLLLEQIDANFKTILNALGCNQNLFINSTYENMRHGLIATHNDTVVPYADQFTQGLTDANIGVPKGFRLILDYSHLPYLQTNKVEEADTYLTVSNALNQLVTSGVITTAEAKIRLDSQFGK